MERSVTVYGPLRSATGAKVIAVDVTGGTVADVVEAVVDAYPRSRPYLYDGGEVRPSVRVAVDGERATLDAPVPADAEVTLFPAVQGG